MAIAVEVVPAEVVTERTTPIRPSEALRLAALQGLPQYQGGMEQDGKYCALGAIAYIRGLWDDSVGFREVDLYAYFHEEICGNHSHDLASRCKVNRIIDLNDGSPKLTFSEIADKIEAEYGL